MEEVEVYRLETFLNRVLRIARPTYSGHNNVLALLLISGQEEVVVYEESMQILPAATSAHSIRRRGQHTSHASSSRSVLAETHIPHERVSVWAR